MKVYISADMEGISGVVDGTQTSAEDKDYERFRRLMTAEVNAAVEGALAGGATEVLVNDAHASMRNILVEELLQAAQLVSGYPKPLAMMAGLDERFAVAFFVGYHARVGTGQAVLDHTWSSRTVYAAHLNGQLVGELGLNAALAGHYGVPVALVTGDAATTGEARELLGDIEVVAVKEGLGRSAARCLAPKAAQEQIRQAAQRAVQRPGKPFVVKPPIALAVDFARTAHAELAALIPGSRLVGGRRVEYTAEDMAIVYQTWQAMTYLAGAAER